MTTNRPFSFFWLLFLNVLYICATLHVCSIYFVLCAQNMVCIVKYNTVYTDMTSPRFISPYIFLSRVSFLRALGADWILQYLFHCCCSCCHCCCGYRRTSSAVSHKYATHTYCHLCCLFVDCYDAWADGTYTEFSAFDVNENKYEMRAEPSQQNWSRRWQQWQQK